MYAMCGIWSFILVMISGSEIFACNASLIQDSSAPTFTEWEQTRSLQSQPRQVPLSSQNNECPPEPINWSTMSPLPLERAESQGIAVDGKYYVFGGFYGSWAISKRSDVYDPNTNSWTQIANMPEFTTHAGQISDGKYIYIIGGFLGKNLSSTHHVWIYDTQNNSWLSGPNLPFDRGGGAAVKVGRNIHFFGGATNIKGETDFIDHGDHFVLSLGPTSNLSDDATSWTIAAPMPTPRNHMTGAALNGFAYAIGGQIQNNEASGNLDIVQAYDPNSDSWSTVANLPKPLGHIAASTFVRNNRIVVVGGMSHDLNGSIRSDDIFEYNPIANKWIHIGDLPSGRQSPLAGILGNQLFVAGGYLEIQGIQSTTWMGNYPTIDIPGDINFDRSVDINDLIELSQIWLNSQATIQDFSEIHTHWLLNCN